MIGKLDIKDYEDKEQLVWFGIINKINELVEVVNAMQNLWFEVATVKKIILELQTRAENAQDEFAVQRGWIGKLCKFWNDEDEGYIYDILIDIEDDGSGYPYKIVGVDSKDWTISYKHCEPVPEDLIYKGGNNE